jgi:tRNA (cytidine/uridine-2'-O-)-methyltransferase
MLPSLRRLNIVLLHPDIPGNTGCIGRSVMAAGCRLHLVHPLGFSTDDRALRRAGLDYWPRVDVTEHASWNAFVEAEFGAAAWEHASQPSRTTSGQALATAWLLTTKSRRPHWEARFSPGDYLLFGSETRGAAAEVHDWVGSDHAISLPICASARSINLAAAASAALFEAVRQVNTRGTVR